MKKKSMTKISQETLNELKQLFPGCVSGENVNFEKLRKLLGDNIILNSESYGLNWFGRDKTFDQINASVTGKLTPQTSLSVNPSKTKNVLIDGDNLQVLKILRKNYKGKIKMIYIDPPYNTGKDRLYQDNFMTVDQDILKTIKDSKDSAELSHSAWISMIYARLFVARELLSEDG
ncbi:MAG: DNA methyltransferase, partial [Candidatus Marinimicrobia bacterium]|nr:DNA methyltransferase [Candidatus Neomarinimicrobiota bacterium]